MCLHVTTPNSDNDDNDDDDDDDADDDDDDDQQSIKCKTTFDFSVLRTNYIICASRS